MALLRAKKERYAENKPDKELIEAFFQNKVGATSRNREYYIIAGPEIRFLLHRTTPLAAIQGRTIYLNSEAREVNSTDFGIRKFLTDLRAQKAFKVSLVSKSSLVQDLKGLPPQSLDKLAEAVKRFGATADILEILTPGTPSDAGYSSDQEMFQSAFKQSSIRKVKAEFYKKIEELLLNPSRNSEEIIAAFLDLPKIIITSQEEALLQKLNAVESPFVKGVYSLIVRHSSRVIESYYDIATRLITEGVDLSSTDLEGSYKQVIAPQLTGNEPQVFRSYIKKLSDAYSTLRNNKVLLDAAVQSGDYDFFTLLGRVSQKDLEKVTKSKDTSILKDESGSMRKYISQLSNWTMQVFTTVKYKATDSFSKGKQRFSYYATAELKDQYEILNNALEKSLSTVLSDPEVQQALIETASSSQDLVSTIIRTGGELEEKVNFNPKAPLTDMVKQFLSAAFKFRGFGLGSNDNKGPTEYFSSSSADIFKYQAFVNSVSNETLAKRLKSGFIWSGVYTDEYAPSSARRGTAIEIPLGTIAYEAKGGKADKQISRKTILGNGQILKVEVEDNFLRFSVHSYHATLSGQQRQTEVTRMLQLKNEMYRMYQDITNVLTATGVGDKIISKVLGKSSAYDKELKAFFNDKDAPVNCFIVNSGGTLALSEMGTGDYFKSENVRSRGFTYYELQELYQSLASGKAKDKFMDTLFQHEIKGCLDALERYIDTAVVNGQARLEKMGEANLTDMQESAWLTDKEFYRQNIIADLQYHVGDQFQFGTHAFYPLYDESGKAKSTVAKASRAFIVRSSVNPVMVGVTALGQVDNLGNDILTHAQKNIQVYKKLQQEFNSLISKNGTEFDFSESGATAMPMMHQGPVMTDLRTIISDSRRRYVNPTGRTVTIPISDYLKGGLGEKYQDYFDADYHIQYHEDLDLLLKKMENVYSINLRLADLMNLSKESFTITDEQKEVEVNFLTQFDKAMSLQLGVALRKEVKNKLVEGVMSLRELISNVDAFSKSVEGEGIANLPIDKIKESYTDTISNTLTGIYTQTLETLDAAYRTENLSGQSAETNSQAQKFIEKMNAFESLRRELRAESKELMLILSKYAAEKNMLVDMIRTGRVLNFLLSEAEGAKRSKERKDNAVEAGEDNVE